MLTKRNRFYTAIRGRIIHATSIEGLQGIIRDGMILPNCDGSKGYAYWGKQIASYCQRKGGISVMDLLSIDETKLFDAKGPAHHWTGVFCFHHPTILLLLSNKHVAPYLFHPAPPEETSCLGLFIKEVEACCGCPIPVEWILGGMVIGKRHRIILRSNNLSTVLERARQVRNYSRHRRKFIVKST
jgi:hypothetical protein